MTSKKFFYHVIAVAVGIGLIAGAARAGSRSAHGATSVYNWGLEAQKPKKFDEMRSAIRIPNDIDPSRPLEYACFLGALKRNPTDLNEIIPVKKVKAEWESHAYVLNQRDGSFQALDVGAGTFKTGDHGDLVSIPVPTDVTAAIFADGFESGDVSAFLVAHARLTRGKKINDAGLRCILSESDR